MEAGIQRVTASELLFAVERFGVSLDYLTDPFRSGARGVPRPHLRRHAAEHVEYASDFDGNRVEQLAHHFSAAVLMPATAEAMA